MANAANGNTLYIDSTGAVGPTKNVRISGIFMTSTAATASLILRDGSTNKARYDIAAANTTEYFDVSAVPMYFPNGVTVNTVTNCVATLIFSRGGQSDG